MNFNLPIGQRPKVKKYQKRYRELRVIRLKKEKLCVRCGKSKPRTGLLECFECVEKQKQYCQTIMCIKAEDRPAALIERNKKNKRCFCCGSKNHRGRGWHIDHDHKTKRFRGILCNNCNTGLGQFKDSVAVLKKAISYLERFYDRVTQNSTK